MLGYLLLFVALVLYFIKRCRFISLFLYVSFMLGYSGGFGLWTDEVLGAKNMDLALVYTFVINGFLLLTRQNLFRPFHNHSHAWLIWYKVLIVFLLCSAVFSYIHYHFTPYQILQGGRSYLLLLSLPILVRVKPVELQRILELCLWITVLTSVLYILQVVFGRPLMPYNGEYSIDPTTGLARLYNSPALLGFFLIASFVCPRFFPGNINVYRVLFFAAVMCTLGRTFIFTTLFGVVLATVFTGKASTLMKTIAVLGILFMPFFGIISQRFEKGETRNDINRVMSGGATNYGSGDGTMTFRMAWIYERYDYLKDRPIGEQVFGLGLISESQSVVNKKYRFSIGLSDEDGIIGQLSTPDTSYGNLLTKLGFVGVFIYLGFCICLAVFIYRKRMEFPMLIVCAASFTILFINSMSSSALSEPRNFTFYFLAVGMLTKGHFNNRLLDRDSKWLLTHK